MGFFSELHRSKSALNALPRFSRSRLTPAGPSSLRQGSSFFTRCSRPTLLGASPCSSPSSSSPQPRSFFGLPFVSRMLPSSLSEPFEAGSTQSFAKRVVNEVWRNLDPGSPSWTLHLEGPGWQASVLDCPDLSAGCLQGGKSSVSPESLNFCRKDAETATVTARELVEHTLASHEAEMLVQDLCLVIDRIQMVERRCGTGFFSSIMRPEMEMIMQDHCLVTRPRMLPLYLVIALFCSMLAIHFACLFQIAGKRLKQITSKYNHVPSLDRRQGLSFSQPTLLGACPRALPSSSVQLSSFIYGFQVKIPGPQPFQARGPGLAKFRSRFTFLDRATRGPWLAGLGVGLSRFICRLLPGGKILCPQNHFTFAKWMQKQQLLLHTREEVEDDYIGSPPMASAGYDT